MRHWQLWWQTLVLSSQQNPPRLIEVIMLLLAMALLIIWGNTEQWQYLVLSLSYVIGSSTSLLVREAMIPSARPRITQVTAALLLILSFYTFIDLIRYL